MDNSDHDDDIDGLVTDLKDDRRDVRSRAAYELGKRGAARAVPALVAALSDPDKFVRSWAADALGKTGPVAAAALTSVLDGADPTAATYAALALGHIGDLHAVACLAQALKSADYDIRPRAAATLRELSEPGDLFDRLLADRTFSPSDRVQALRALSGARYSDDEVEFACPEIELCPLLEERLRNGDTAIREGAEETLPAARVAEEVDREAAAAAGTAQEEAVPQSDTASAERPPTAGDSEAQITDPEATPRRSFWSKIMGR